MDILKLDSCFRRNDKSEISQHVIPEKAGIQLSNIKFFISYGQKIT